MEVIVSRQTKLKLSEDDEEPVAFGDYAVIPDDLYEAHADWFTPLEDVPVAEWPAEALDTLTVERLQDELRALDLPVTGKKSELIERLTHA